MCGLSFCVCQGNEAVFIFTAFGKNRFFVFFSLAIATDSLYTLLNCFRWCLPDDRARSSAGEHYVDIVGVTGSIPVAPTISGWFP